MLWHMQEGQEKLQGLEDRSKGNVASEKLDIEESLSEWLKESKLSIIALDRK